MADVTVVVITRDRAADLRVSLPRHGAYPVVVVDNGSSDDGPEVAEASGARVVRLGRNRGAAARTVGCELAGTRYVAFADDDSWWAPGALEVAVTVLDDHPRLAVLAGRVLVGPEERLDPVCAEMAGSPLLPTAAGPSVLGFVACGAVVRAQAYLAVGGFCERYGVGGEEELLALDLAAAGWQLAYVDDVVAHHHPSPARDPQRRAVVQARNTGFTALLRRPLPVVATSLLGALTRPTGRRALVEVLRSLPWLLRHRRPLPARVERDVRLLQAVTAANSPPTPTPRPAP